MQLASSAAGHIHQELSLLHLSRSPIYLPAQGFTILIEEKKRKEEEKQEEEGSQGKVPALHFRELGDRGQAPEN